MHVSGKPDSWFATALRPAALLLALALLPALATALWHPKRPPPQAAQTANSVGHPNQSPQLTLAEIRQEPRFRQALWIDARPPEAYALGHVPGAVRLSEAEWETSLPSVLDRWQPEMPIIVYCNSTQCGTAQSVADRLRRELGYDHVYVLRGGWEAWRP